MLDGSWFPAPTDQHLRPLPEKSSILLGLGPEKEKKIFGSRYKLLLPSEAELKAELLRELKSIGPAAAARPDQAKQKPNP